MKRPLIAASIIASATCLFGAAQSRSLVLQKLNATRSEQYRAQAAQLEQLRTERNELRQQVDEARRNGRLLQRNTSVDELAEEYAKNGLTNMSPAQAEQLRAELGFNWNSPRDYIFVSKKSLPSISLSAISNGKLTDGIRAVLAMTPEEETAIEMELRRVNDEYNAWSLAHVQRQEPKGNVLANYVLPADTQSSNTLQSFSAVVRNTLNSDARDQLFFEDIWNWGNAHQLTSPALEGHPAQSVMVIRRSGNALVLYLQQPNSSWSVDITPSLPFPEAFLPIFPGGWKELAEREGFELPEK
jgi:cell division protein FtsB